MSEAPAVQAPPADAGEFDEFAGLDIYWGSDETDRFYLPDGRQYFEFKIMNEGEKARFQRTTNRDITIEQKTQNAKMRVDPALERHELIKTSVTDWHLVGQDDKTGRREWVRFTKDKLDKWLTKADPKIVEQLEHKIRMANPWMSDEMTVEQIDEELNRLRELREQVEAREAGEGASASN